MTDSMIPYSFIPGTKVKAGEVNANFVALADVIEQNRQTNANDIQSINEILETKANSTDLARDFVVNTAETNLNNYKTPGSYLFTSTYKPTNIPTGNSGVLLVLGNGSRIKQVWFSDGAIPDIYVRLYSGSSWGAWATNTSAKNASNLGYVKMANGTIIQWGYATFDSNSTSITFPISFNSTPQICFGGRASANSVYAVGALYTARSATGFTAHGWKVSGTADASCSWIAVGY